MSGRLCESRAVRARELEVRGTELAKKVCPRLRDPASGRGGKSRNLGQTFLANFVEYPWDIPYFNLGQSWVKITIFDLDLQNPQLQTCIHCNCLLSPKISTKVHIPGSL